jgi:hypothetical protein
MDNNWLIVKASVIGNSHITENLPCQDSHGYKFFSKENFGVAVVSDGAGSADFSDLGSGKVVEQALKKFSTLIKTEKLYEAAPEETIWKEKSIQVFKEIFAELQKFADEENINYKTLAATAIVVAIMPYGIIATHIGDGRAGYLNDNGEWFSCITPYKGELANETVFITSDFWEKDNLDQFIESRIIQDSVSAFTLLTDGCENVCFELNKFNSETQLYERLNNPYSGFFNHNIGVLKSLHSTGLTEEEINSMWANFLTNGLESFANELDDKTLLLAIKINNEKEKEEINIIENAE